MGTSPLTASPKVHANNSALKKERQKLSQKYKDILGHIISLRPSWGIRGTVLKPEMFTIPHLSKVSHRILIPVKISFRYEP